MDQASFRRQAVDQKALRRYRLDRVRGELKKGDLAGLVLFDPINIRYATGSRNMQVWVMHNAARYAFVAAEGPVVVFDFHNCEHLSNGIETIDEVRPAMAFTFFSSGSRMEERARRWAAEIAELVTAHGGGNRRLGVDRLDPLGLWALESLGVEVCDGQGPLERARALKSPVEIEAMRCSIAACEEGMRRMHHALTPGITENALWSILHQANIEQGGEWIETRLLSSGPRTNPWFQECGGRRIEAGDMVSFDTDLIGPHGYCSDLSRSWVCGEVKPTDRQRRTYALAVAQIEHNQALLKPGVSFREVIERSFKLPQDCAPNRYSCILHGVGLCDEYPAIYYGEDAGDNGYDGVLEEGITVCVESYIGSTEGGEGVKLEQQVLIGAGGAVPLSTYPLEDALM